MTEAERLAERFEELLAKAEQEDDDIRYYSGSSSKYAPHRDALNIAMSEALPVLLSALRSQAEELERLRGAQKSKLITPVAVLNDDGSQSFSSQALGEM